MKFFCNDEVYVHQYDLANLNITGQDVPACVAEQDTGPRIITTANQFDLVKFDQPEQVEFFRSVDWIMDFNQLTSMSTRELKMLRSGLIKRRDRCYDEFNRMKKAEKEACYEQRMHDGLALFHQVGTITNFLKYRSGRLKMQIPFAGYVQKSSS